MQPAPLPNGPVAVPKILAALVRMRPARAWMLVLLCMDLAAIGDLTTGPELWFGPVYLFVICLAAWSLGWSSGQAVGVACMALTFAINGISLYPYGSAALLSNFAMRFAAVSLVIVVVAAMRRAYVREWYLARTDVLTGAFNRQAFFELGAGLCARAGWRLLVYADLDGLKAINDNRGHAAGDACLRLYAAGVRKTIRRDDLFARVGGDEFLLFLAVRDEAAAQAVAARLHGRMNAIAARDGAPLRCSVGALAVPPGERSIDDLVRLADGLMYEAKLAGAGLRQATAPGSGAPPLAGRARVEVRRSRDGDRRVKLAA
jgi:diguanylate cyclase (GGDEF)-like protein